MSNASKSLKQSIFQNYSFTITGEHPAPMGRQQAPEPLKAEGVKGNVSAAISSYSI